MKYATAGVTICLMSSFSFTQLSATEVLFANEPTNRTNTSRLAQLDRGEFETRMFAHAKWHQRLSYFSTNPDVDETLEVYSRPDGTRWLSHRTASPSIYSIILARLMPGAKFNLSRKLDTVRITKREVMLPSEVAKELDRLWDTMLPGVEQCPPPKMLYTHVPSFYAFSQRNGNVIAGGICLAAYDSPIYATFVAMIGDLRMICDNHTAVTDPLFQSLPEKIRAISDRVSSRPNRVRKGQKRFELHNVNFIIQGFQI